MIASEKPAFTDSVIESLSVLFGAAEEQGMWIRLCRLYSSGVEVDSIIRATLEHDAVTCYGAQSEVALTYYMAKFDLKRGNVAQSNQDLGRLSISLKKNKSKIEGACTKRMATLVDIRALTNNAKPSADHTALFERAIGSLQDLNYASNDYKRTRPHPPSGRR